MTHIVLISCLAGEGGVAYAGLGTSNKQSYLPCKSAFINATFVSKIKEKKEQNISDVSKSIEMSVAVLSGKDREREKREERDRQRRRDRADIHGRASERDRRG